ncbi:MAG: NAD(P)H-quinone oxidoreductase subunit 4, partial [Prochloraceae cyanobacterium]
LAAVGVILTPIYLLSMLRVIFYGKNNNGLKLEEALGDANPRELCIGACMLVPIIVLGFYPKLVTDSYDVKTAQIATKISSALPTLAQVEPVTNSETAMVAPSIPTKS